MRALRLVNLRAMISRKIRLDLLCFVFVGQNSPFKISRRSEKVGVDLSHFMLYFLHFLTSFDKNVSEYFIDHKRLLKTYFLFTEL